MKLNSLKSSQLVLALVAAGAIGGASVTALQHVGSAQAVSVPTVTPTHLSTRA